MGLTSRERVLMALNHEETDRVPIDLGSSRSTGINANAYNQLKQHLGITTDTVCFDVKQDLAYADFDLLKRLGSDVVILPRLVPSVGIPIDRMKPGQLPCGGGDCLLAEDFNPVDIGGGTLGIFDKEGHLLAKRPKDGLYFDECYNPLQNVETEEEIDRLLEQSGAKLVCLENSHNFSGGYCIDLPTMAEIRRVADRRGASIHLDGARLFHAAAHLNTTADQICQYADSVMFCVSKGLGAPVGSLLCGTKEFCARARTTRKLLGGVMRQAGVIAAPALYALEHNIQRLQEDIDNARLIHERLQGRLEKLHMQEEVQTNILMLDLSDAGIKADGFCARAKEKGLHIRPIRNDIRVRLVLYKGITRQDAEAAADILLELDRSLRG